MAKAKKPARRGHGSTESLHHRAYRFRIVETPEQAASFARIAGCCRLVYNLALEQRRDHGRRYRIATGFWIGSVGQRNELPALKEVAGFLAEAPSHCLQQALIDLHKAFVNFFDGRAAYPKPRRRFENDSFRFPDAKQITWDAANGLLYLPKFGMRKTDAGPLRLVAHRKIKGRIRHVTIIRDGLHWYASIAVGFRKKKRKDAVRDRLLAGDPLRVQGIDRGVAVPVASAAPVSLVPDSPKGSGSKAAPAAIVAQLLGAAVETEAERRKTKRLAKRLSRKKKGSKNRLKAKKRLASHKARLARRRKDLLRKLAAAIMAGCDIVVFEALRLKAMTASAKGTVEEPGRNVRQRAGLNREMRDRGLGMFVRFCEEIAAREGKRVLFVPAPNTSRECAACHTIDGESRDARVFVCTCCGHEDHADINAATVVRHRAAAEIAALVQSIMDETHSAGGTPAPVCGGLGVARPAKQKDRVARPVKRSSGHRLGSASAPAAH